MTSIKGPAEIAENYVHVGEKKVHMPLSKVFVLAIFAGMFIGIGGVAATVAAVGIKPLAIGKILGACAFPGGLAMVIIAGAELFTGNCLLSIPLLERAITWKQLLTNWMVVYLGNFLGGILVAAVCVYSHQFSFCDGEMAISAVSAAASKCTLTFSDALLRGIACNVLVCIAVWMAFAAVNVQGKIIGLFFPIFIFVLCGFEHCVANMYYVTAGLMAKSEYASVIAGKVDVSSLTWGNFLLKNLIPVTIGNIIGGAVVVGAGYWFVYLRGRTTSTES